MSDILTRKEVAEFSTRLSRHAVLGKFAETTRQAVELLERYDRWANKAPWEAEPFDNDKWTADVRRFLEEYDK